MNRAYNFSSGPAALPEPVLQKAQQELLNYKHSGMSVMELSHRGREFTEILETAESLLRTLMQIPANYKVLFLQGGASAQFSMIPMNLMTIHGTADYADTGVWSYKAIKEAEKRGTVRVVASSREQGYAYIPEIDSKDLNPLADYCHITTNNTIYGTQYTSLPDTGAVPLVADMSSDILSKVYDVSRFGLIYAGAQKNMGPSGLTTVIIREDLLQRSKEELPSTMNYKLYADNGSMYNTPPTFSIYICKLVLEWLQEMGGIRTMEEVNTEKANILYGFIDGSKLFRTNIEAPYRSMMNAPFTTGNEDLDAVFIKEAAENGLLQLKGHRTVGGMRASIYNAMPLQGVLALVDFMSKFELKNV